MSLLLSMVILLSYVALRRSFPVVKSVSSCVGGQRVVGYTYFRYLSTHRPPPSSKHALKSTPSTIADANTLPDCKRRLESLVTKLGTSLSRESLGYKQLVFAAKDLEMTSMQPEFWDDQSKAQAVLTALNNKKALVSKIDDWFVQKDDIATILEMAAEDPADSVSYLTEALSMLARIERDINAFELQRMLSGKYDRNSCVLTIGAGAGGTDAQDWVAMLYRMYKRYAERKGFQLFIQDESSADVGYKSVEIRIEGEYAYGYLAGEKGTHR